MSGSLYEGLWIKAQKTIYFRKKANARPAISISQIIKPTNVIIIKTPGPVNAFAAIYSLFNCFVSGFPGHLISMILILSDYNDLTFLMCVILYLIQVPVGDCTAHTIGKITILLLFDGDLSQSVPASEILIVSCFDYIIVIHLNSPPVSRMETSLLK